MRLRMLLHTLLPLVIAVAVSMAFAADDASVDEARRLFEQRKYPEAAAAWQQVIDDSSRSDVVTSGDAHWFVAESLRHTGAFDDAAATLSAYVKAYPKSEGRYRAHRGLFFVWVSADDAAAAQKQGKKLLAEWPDAPGCYAVVVKYLQRGWNVPRLKTSYAALRKWTWERTDGKRDPGLRIAFIDLIERHHPREDVVKEGGTLYARIWAHAHAQRHDEVVELSKKYLAKFRGESREHEVRFMYAEACLALPTPDLATARAQLAPLARDEKSSYRERAERLLEAVESGGASVQIEAGFPTAEGLGRLVVLTEFAQNSAHWKALAPLIEYRSAEVVRLKNGDVARAAKALREHGAEFVALAVYPKTVDINFQLDVLDVCRNLDSDPLPDFHFGYLCARDADDLAAFVKRVIAKDKAAAAGETNVKVGTVSATNDELTRIAALDAMIHFGHGQAWCVEQGLKAEEVGALELTLAPVVFSGACFNGVLSRSYHPSVYQDFHAAPVDIPPERLMTLNWVHAGIGGYLAALEADRGEMAYTEWEYFLEHAAPLGEVIGEEYRIIFTSLPESHPGVRRFVAGGRKQRSYYDVMLQGAVSRILLGDPMFRPLREPRLQPTSTQTVALAEDGSSLTVTVRVKLGTNRFINYLPHGKKNDMDWRVYARAALPEGFTGRLGAPLVTARRGKTATTLVAETAKHEAWGGRRYVNVLAESLDQRLAQPGSVVQFVFPVQYRGR